MKKLLSILSFLSLTLLLKSQLTGDGTYSNPWSGTLTGDATWSGTKYINGDIIVDNEKLSINEGAVIIFLTETADLIITGTGQLEANGTSSNMITFTSDDNNNGIYGESSERWGHISFQNMTVNYPELYTSRIENSIIEFGQKNSSPQGSIESYGGGLYIAFSYIAVSNCIIRYNYAGWGGGLFIASSFSPTITNCFITQNTSGTTGGGILINSNNSTQVSNCVIEKNISLGSGGAGGIFLGEYPGDVRIYNCVIASNISSLNYGHNILFYYKNPTTYPKFYNTIVWGNNNPSITYWNYTPSSDDFNYCAMTSLSSNYISCINISSSNSALDGPNFTDPDDMDYSISFISPCIDKGTSTGAPPYDILGNVRITNHDIGAYENQYSRWTGATNTSWSTTSNWYSNIDPETGSGDVLIPSGLSTYPTSTSNPDFTIDAGKYMILNPGAKVTLESLVNNGTLKLVSNSAEMSTLIVNSYSGNDAAIEIFLSGGGTKTTYKWHYISTPISSLPVTTFTSVTPDIVRYYDDRVTTDLSQGWVAQDGWIYATGSFGGPTFTTLTPGRGYDYYDSANNTFTFSGQLNTSDVPMALEFAGGANNGFNLLGNPFSSGLDWDYIISQPEYPTNTSKGLYFTRDNTLCSYIAGVGTPFDVNGFIPPMQGFFTKTYATGKTITLAAAAKTHSAHSRYKGTGTIPLIRLSLADDTLSDETVIRFDEKASASLDYDFDALKIFYSPENTAIYSVSEGSKYVINGQPFPDTTVSIPVGVNLLASGIHTITTTQLQGLDTYGVYLKDNVTGFTTDLKTNPIVTFTASAGSVPDRFILKISNYTTWIPETNISKSLFNIFHGFGSVNIQTLADDWDGIPGSVTIFDMTGRKVHELRNVEFVKNSIISLSSPDSKGIYIVELKSGMKRYAEKVVIK